jgi:hypothetical protein
MLYRTRFLRVMSLALARRPKSLDDEFVVHFRMVPFLDTEVTRLFAHTFSMLMTLARYDITFNSELRSVALRKRWIPFTAAETIAYWKPIHAFELVEVKTRLVCWDAKRFYLAHRLDVGAKTRAVGYAQALIRGPEGILHPHEVFAEAGVRRSSPPFPKAITDWASALASDRAATKSKIVTERKR